MSKLVFFVSVLAEVCIGEYTNRDLDVTSSERSIVFDGRSLRFKPWHRLNLLQSQRFDVSITAPNPFDKLAMLLLARASGGAWQAEVPKRRRRRKSRRGALVASQEALPTHYRALVARTTGNSFSEVATVVEKPMPSVGKGEVLIRVVYAGVNGGCETFRCRGEFAFADNKEASDGFALGAEGVGVVVAMGDDVTSVALGDAVCFVGSAFAEYTKVKPEGLWIIPEPAPEYVGLRISALTSCAMLEKTGKLQSGETVLITAAAGGAGHFAVQFAKLAGCIVIGTCSSAEKAAALCKLGCDFIINHRTQDVGEKLNKFAPKGLDAVLEGVGGDMLRTSLDHLSPKGRLLQVGYISEYPHNPKASEEAAKHSEDAASLFWKSETIHRGEQTIYGNAWPKDFAAIADCKDRVLSLHANNKLVSLVDNGHDFIGIDTVSEAVEYMLSGKAIGKVVVKMT